MTNGAHYTRERLVEAASQCSDLDEVITFFGTRPYGYLRKYLTKRFAHFGIDISHFRPCGRSARPTAPRSHRQRCAKDQAAQVDR